MVAIISILVGFVLGQGKSFDAQLKNYLDEKLSSYSKYEYQVVQKPKEYSRIEINSEKNFRLNKNYGYVPVKIYDKNNSSTFSLLTVRVKLFNNVLVAANTIERGQKFSNASFKSELIDVSTYEGKIFNRESELENFRSKVLIKEGVVISESMVEQIPVVVKGDKLTMHAGGNSVDISLNVIARQDGCVGDVISVSSTGSKLYKAKIIDKNNLMLVE